MDLNPAAAFLQGLTFDLGFMRSPPVSPPSFLQRPTAPAGLFVPPHHLLPSPPMFAMPMGFLEGGGALLGALSAAAFPPPPPGVALALHGTGPPGPVTTREFPWRRVDRKRPIDAGADPSARRRPGCGASAAAVDEACAICLEPLRRQVGRLPCRHRLHHACMWGILPMPVLGASSMLRCPLCRQALDRHDLDRLGYDVSPRRLADVARGCRDFRALLQGHGPASPMEAVFGGLGRPSAGPAERGALVQRILGCGRLGPADGFVYNTCVLPLERMLHHRLGFVHNVAAQLAMEPGTDACDLIENWLSCHVDVLMHTSGFHDNGAD